MHTHHCLFTPALASPCRPLYPKDPREAVQKLGASVIMLCNYRLAHLHAANKPGIPVACCPTSHLVSLHFLCLLLQAQPEVLFEGTVAEGAPFKVQAAITDPSGFADFDDAPIELEFRCATVSTHFGVSSRHLSTRWCHWVLMSAPFELESGCAAGPMHSCHNVTVNRETSETNTV